MQTEAAIPSQSGPLGAAVRNMIDASPLVRKVVKSEPGQRIIQTLRAAPHIRAPGRFLVRTLTQPRCPSVYTIRGTTTHIVLRHRTDDVLVFNEVFHRRAYAFPSEVVERLQKIHRPLHVVDLGANVGMFSAWMITCLPDVQIDAYEPDPQNASVLRRMTAVNDVENRVRIHEACAGTKLGVVRFVPGDFIHSRVAANNDIEGVELPQHDVMPLLEKADLVKIDIEGSEWPILADERWLRTAALAVTMEWHGTNDVIDGEARATAALERAGLSIVHSYSEQNSCGILWAVRPSNA